MKRTRKLLLITLAVSMLTALMAATAMAEPTAGWVKKDGNVYYYMNSSSGLVKAVGLQKIKDRYYYFNKSGVMKTGWLKTADGYRYFRKTGDLGLTGKMYTGFSKIFGDLFYFNRNGILQTGLITLKKGTYLFRTEGEAGTLGKAYVSSFATFNGKRYYFDKNGRMVKSKWVGKYYLGADGAKLRNTVTPDGYQVDGNGKRVSDKKVNGWVKIQGKWRYYSLKKNQFLTSTFISQNGNLYYVNSSGYRLRGWQTIAGNKYYFGEKGVAATGSATIDGKDYYFSEKGRLQVSQTVNGYTTDENGVITKRPPAGRPKILIVAGHGQGDPGATSSLGQESVKTREFAQLIYEKLQATGKVDVTYYKNGSTSYDLYQQNARTFGSSGLNMSSKITGSGSSKKKVIKGFKNNSHIPDLSSYDYVLEIHFNATGYNLKDIKGNGKYKGFSFYVNSHKKSHKLEKAIISKINSLGFATFGNGVHPSSTLFNARVITEVGTDYSLVETAFIDDRDDMKFYKGHKKRMAQVIVDCIVAYYVK